MLIASGDRDSIRQLGDYEDQFAEGEKGILTLRLSGTAGSGIVRMLQGGLNAAGLDQWKPVEETPGRLKIYFKKAVPWAAIVIAVLIGLIILWLILTGWELDKIIPGLGKWWLIIADGAILALVAYVAYAYSKGRLKA